MAKRRVHSKKTAKLKLQKLMIYLFLAICIFVSGLILGGSIFCSQQAEASSLYDETVFYKSIMVREGDTLWSLAEQYHGGAFEDYEDYIREVLRLNNISDGKIHSGAHIMIPYVETSYHSEL